MRAWLVVTLAPGGRHGDEVVVEAVDEAGARKAALAEVGEDWTVDSVTSIDE